MKMLNFDNEGNLSYDMNIETIHSNAYIKNIIKIFRS